MKRIYSASSLPEAHLLLHRLLAENIEASVFNENAQSGVGELPFTHAYPEVWIKRAEDEKRARLLVQEFDSPEAASDGLICSNCGEQNPSTFELCWQCASILDTVEP